MSLLRRAADASIGFFVPRAEAKADTWGKYCYCRTYPYFERWIYGPGGVPKNLGCLARREWMCT